MIFLNLNRCFGIEKSCNGTVQITDRMLMHPDARTVLRSVLKGWLPLSEAVLSMAVEHLPDPASAAPGRLARLLPPQQLHLKGVQLPKDLQQVWVGLTSWVMFQVSVREACEIVKMPCLGTAVAGLVV